MTVRAGGEMWRPVLDVRDAAKAYVTCLEAPDNDVAGQALNVVFGNIRVSEMALRVRTALVRAGVDSEIHVDYADRPVRSYRVSGRKIGDLIGFTASGSIEEAVGLATERLRDERPDFEAAKYYNIRALDLLEAR